jgi:hypothetical protein
LSVSRTCPREFRYRSAFLKIIKDSRQPRSTAPPSPHCQPSTPRRRNRHRHHSTRFTARHIAILLKTVSQPNFPSNPSRSRAFFLTTAKSKNCDSGFCAWTIRRRSHGPGSTRRGSSEPELLRARAVFRAPTSGVAARVGRAARHLCTWCQSCSACVAGEFVTCAHGVSHAVHVWLVSSSVQLSAFVDVAATRRGSGYRRRACEHHECVLGEHHARPHSLTHDCVDAGFYSLGGGAPARRKKGRERECVCVWLLGTSR